MDFHCNLLDWLRHVAVISNSNLLLTNFSGALAHSYCSCFTDSMLNYAFHDKLVDGAFLEALKLHRNLLTF